MNSEPTDFLHKVVVKTDDSTFGKDRYDWCVSRFGPEGFLWVRTVRNSKNVNYYFVNEEDSVLFKLAWLTPI